MIGDIHQTTGHPIRLICSTLGVPRSSYYHAATPTPSQLSDHAISDRIEAIFRSHRRRYGYRRIQSELSDEGLTCAPARVRRLMQERGLKAIQPPHLRPPDQRWPRRSPLPEPPPRPTPAFPAQPSLGRRYHLHPHLHRLDLSSCRHRPLLPAHRRLGSR